MERPNPDRIFAVVASILERRYDVKIQYITTNTEGGNYEQNRR